MSTDHRCSPPETANGRWLSWECGLCGRVWQAVYNGALMWWEETRGPRA